MLSDIDTTPLVTIVSDYGVTSVPSLSEHSRFQSEHLADAARPIGIGATTWPKVLATPREGQGLAGAEREPTLPPLPRDA